MLSLVFEVTVIQRVTGTFGARCCGDSFTTIIPFLTSIAPVLNSCLKFFTF